MHIKDSAASAFHTATAKRGKHYIFLLEHLENLNTVKYILWTSYIYLFHRFGYFPWKG